MNVRLYQNGVFAHHAEWLGAFAEGLARHGIRGDIVSMDAYEPSDLAVLWGHHNTKVIASQRKAGLDHIVMERGYVGDRMTHTSIGFNGVNGAADFLNHGSPPDRWKALGVELKPWKVSGEYILLCGQIPGDASTHGIDLKVEFPRLAIELANMHRRPVYWRPHPLRPTRIQVPIPTLTGSLEDALAGAWCIVTVNSNTAVDATIAGVPAITMDKRSMAWGITRHDIMYSLIPWRPNRCQWAYDIAYAQWTKSEIIEGLAWEHLSRKFK